MRRIGGNKLQERKLNTQFISTTEIKHQPEIHIELY